MSSAVINKTSFKREQKYVIERIAKLREELEDLVAYLNLLKWRTKKSSGPNKLYYLSWRDHTNEQIQILEPRLVIAIGTGAGEAFRRHYSGQAALDAIPRLHNNIGQAGRDAIKRIGKWLKQHPLNNPTAR